MPAAAAATTATNRSGGELIAAIWTAGPRWSIDEALHQLTAAVGVAPSDVLYGSRYALACWSLAYGGHIDAKQRLAWIGDTRPVGWRADDLSAVHGEYALVMGTGDGLTLARGRHAGRCLYYTEHIDTVIACSRYYPLIRCTDRLIPNVQDLASLMLLTSPSDLGATAIQGIRRVESSQVVCLGRAKTSAPIRRQLPLGSTSASVDEIAGEVQRKIEAAVARSIRGARRVAVLTSGGLDSGAILATAIALTRGANAREAQAVNLSFAGQGDDRPYFAELCAALGIVPVRVLPSDASGDVAAALVADGAPCVWPTAAWHRHAGQLMQRVGIDVVLTGQGGDHVFGADPLVLVRSALSGECEDGARFLHFEGRSVSASLRDGARVLLAAGSVSRAISAHRRRRAATAKWRWAGPRLKTFINEWVHMPPNLGWMRPDGQPKFVNLIRHDFLQLARTCGQMEAMTGLKRIDPLLDTELVELLAGLPQRMLVLDARQRGLFRRATKDLLPSRLRLRRDKARLEPAISQMVAGRDLTRLRAIARVEMLADLGLVEPRTFIGHFEAVLAGGAARRDWLAIWPTLSAEAFLHAHWGGPHGLRKW